MPAAFMPESNAAWAPFEINTWALKIHWAYIMPLHYNAEITAINRPSASPIPALA
jgi:hypothetical protein